MAASGVLEIDRHEVPLTNLDKVLYPGTGFTKGQVIEHYARVAPAMLPHLRGRPLTLRRFPDGVDGPSRFQKCCPERRPDWFPVARVERVKGGEPMEFCLAEDTASLLWLANQANLEFHPMLALAPALDRPTVVAFDLDPGPPAGLLECLDIALLLRGMLAGVGLESHLKTSGGKGAQVFVPLNTDTTYAETKGFARTVARTLAERLPDRVTATVSRRERPGRVLVDWAQNDRHRSIVAAYSLRGRARPTVSTPLRWPEAEAAVAGGDAASLEFEPADVLARLDQHGDLWQPVLGTRQQLPPP
jgi:bifunctional non-homologous end joining protein LigD